MGTQLNSIMAAARRVLSRPRKVTVNDLYMPSAGPSISDEQASLLWTPVTPERARGILQGALQGDLQQQDQLFRLMLDSWPRLAKATSEVTRAVSRLTYSVQAPEEAGEQAEGWVDLVKRALRSWRPKPGTMEIGFEETLDALIMARHTGLSVCELHWYGTQRGILPRAAWALHAQHLAWNDTGTELGLSVGDKLWAPFEPHKFLVGAWRARPGAPVATALMRPLVPYWVGRTYGYQWLLQFAQIFGMPMRWANYDESRPETGAKVAEMLRNIGSAGWAAFPSGVDMKLVEANANARDNPQLILQELADQACDLLILGQTLSGTSTATGLGSGTATLHGEVRREVITGAAQWVADVLNYQLVPALVEINFGSGADPADLPVIAPDLSSPSDPREEAERLEILVRAGLRIPLKWAHESQGIPEPQEGDEVLKSAGAAEMPANGAGAGNGSHDSGPDLKINLRGSAEGSASSLRATDAGELAPDYFEELTGVTREWMGPVEKTLRRLLALAEAEAVTEQDFAQALADTRAALPELFEEINHEALETALRRTMATAMVNGAVERAVEEAAQS